MLKKMTSFIILLLILFSSFSISTSAWSLNENEGKAEAYYLYNFENDLVISQENVNKTIQASSTVKMMTACVALESGISFDTLITIDANMLKDVSGRFMGLKVGDKMSFGDLLYSMICASFNDAANAIALTVCNTIEDFIALMNKKAEQLGMLSTIYHDITGLSFESKTTIEDLIKLSIYLSKNSDYVSISSTKSYQLSSHATCEYNKISNRSTLISTYKGVANFNTGSNSNKEGSAIIYLQNEKSSFLCIVMNAKSTTGDDNNLAEKLANRLLYHGLYDYSNRVIIKENKTIDSLPVKYAISNQKVDIITLEDIKAYLPDDADINEGISYSYYIYNDELTAPLKNGDDVGTVIISQNGRYITSGKLTVKTSVERNAFLYIMDLMKNFISSRTFIFSLLFFFALMAIFYFKTKSSLDRMYKPGPRSTIKYYRK